MHHYGWPVRFVIVGTVMNSPLNMLAIDIGNSRIKIARFHRPADSSGDWLSTGSGLPEPDEVLAIAPAAPSKEFDFAPLGDWLASQSLFG